MRALAPDPAKDPTLVFEHEQLERYPDYLGVIGLDEAGRGAIAGPVSVGAHVVQRGTTSFPEGLRDSKLLSEARREWIFPTVLEWGIGAVGYGQPGDIDEHGITAMLGRAGRDALLSVHEQGIDVRKCLIVVDGSHDWLSEALLQPLHVVTRVGADRQHASVAAASLRAKVERDRLMLAAHESLPHYAWNKNKGYGAAAHYDGIRQHGLTSQHRASWINPATIERAVH
ncbi:ribonuclease HII [Leucobacter chinensis]|uniref:ribonuclease HII n=1 Tax=Leucobacter chinensis TaxID=2851010 RepID=UPI001C218A34